MKPWKKLSGMVSWLLRLALVLVIYTRFFGIFMQFTIDTTNFYFAAGFVISAFLLLAGGFFKESVTVIAGLIITILVAIKIVMGFNGLTPMLAQWLLMGSASLYFLANGNK